MGRGKNAGIPIFGSDAAKASGFDIDGFVNASKKEQIEILKNNNTANYLFAIAKYYEQNVRTRKILGINENADIKALKDEIEQLKTKVETQLFFNPITGEFE